MASDPPRPRYDNTSATVDIQQCSSVRVLVYSPTVQSWPGWRGLLPFTVPNSGGRCISISTTVEHCSGWSELASSTVLNSGGRCIFGVCHCWALLRWCEVEPSTVLNSVGREVGGMSLGPRGGIKGGMQLHCKLEVD